MQGGNTPDFTFEVTSGQIVICCPTLADRAIAFQARDGDWRVSLARTSEGIREVRAQWEGYDGSLPSTAEDRSLWAVEGLAGISDAELDFPPIKENGSHGFSVLSGSGVAFYPVELLFDHAEPQSLWRIIIRFEPIEEHVYPLTTVEPQEVENEEINTDLEYV